MPTKGIWIPCLLHIAPDYTIYKPQHHLGNRVNSIEKSFQMSYSPIFSTPCQTVPNDNKQLNISTEKAAITSFGIYYTNYD